MILTLMTEAARQRPGADDELLSIEFDANVRQRGVVAYARRVQVLWWIAIFEVKISDDTCLVGYGRL